MGFQVAEFGDNVENEDAGAVQFIGAAVGAHVVSSRAVHGWVSVRAVGQCGAVDRQDWFTVVSLIWVWSYSALTTAACNLVLGFAQVDSSVVLQADDAVLDVSGSSSASPVK